MLLAILVGPRGADAQSVDLTILSPPSPPPIAPGSVTVPPAPDLTPFVGKTITAVDVRVQRSLLPDVEVPAIQVVKPGMTFTARLAREAMDEVLASGVVGEAAVDAQADGAGVRLVVHAVPRAIIDSVRVDLHDAEVDSDELLRDAALQEGDEMPGDEIRTRRRRMEIFMARMGYPAAEVKVTARETEHKNRVAVVVDVKPGAPRKVERRLFYAIDAARDDVSPLTSDYKVRTGDRVQEAQLEAADVDLERRMRAAGWHEARVSHDVVLAKKLVTVRVRLDAGPRYRARFEGNARYDASTLDAALGLADETDFSRQHLVDKVVGFYRARGYLDAEVDLDVRSDATGRMRFLVFQIAEHERALVSARTYPCLKEEEVKLLKNGGPSSAKAIGREIDSFLQEDLPGADLLVDPDPRVVRGAFDGPNANTNLAVPTDLQPETVYAADSYDRAVAHVQDLYRNEGYLSALVGPVQVLRRRCDPKSPPGRCVPVAPPPETAELCTYDARHQPLPTPNLEAAQTCVPDPARNVACEPRVTLRIPIKLGPRTMLYDLAFAGAQAIEQQRLAAAAELVPGSFVSQIKVEDARKKIVDVYKEEGFAYVEVKSSIEKSPDSTRARVRFDVNEGERVIVRKIVIRGNRVTSEGVIRRRIALYEGQPYRTSDIQKTQERIATLGVFSSVTVALQDPYVPTKNKTVIVSVIERTSQYFEIRPGVSSGEGLRGAIEYGHRNLFGTAIALSLRAQASFLPALELPDLYGLNAPSNQIILENFRILEQKDGTLGRIATRLSGSLAFPQIGLGPLVRATVDGVFFRDIQRDYRLEKGAAILSGYWTPSQKVRISVSQTFERNDVFVYQSAKADLCALLQQNDRYRFALRFPEGTSYVVGSKATLAWDRRDNSLSAHKGTFVGAGVEHAVSFPEGSTNVSAECRDLLSPEGHFIKLTQTVGGYIPITEKITLALTLKLGEVVQLNSTSKTYPDRLFYMGGFDSMRGWSQDAFIPQDVIDAIEDPANQAKADNDPTKISPKTIPIRGGDLMVNPRIELRLPVTGPFETVIFGDFGNLWRDPGYIFKSVAWEKHPFPLRVAVGSGIRVQTPVGPLALDYGINLTRLSYEDFGALSFSVGLF